MYSTELFLLTLAATVGLAEGSASKGTQSDQQLAIRFRGRGIAERNTPIKNPYPEIPDRGVLLNKAEITA